VLWILAFPNCLQLWNYYSTSIYKLKKIENGSCIISEQIGKEKIKQMMWRKKSYEIKRRIIHLIDPLDVGTT
jgi:hypothetical protein